jgi:hypothetical protein
MGAFSILLSSKLLHLVMKVTSDLVCMRKHGSGRPKLGGAVAFSVHYATAKTLAPSRNGSKWRSIRRDSRRPNGLAPSTDLLPNGFFRPNGYLAVTASSVRESASVGLQAMFWLTWTLYASLQAPQCQKS